MQPTRTRARGHDAAWSLLSRISGGQEKDLVARVMADPASLEAVASEIAVSAPLETLRKGATTTNVMASGRVDADYDYVGLPKEAADCDFQTLFDTFLRVKLGKRAKGFATLFDHLKAHANPLVIETGCLRIPGNWEGDGQSTFQFDCYARERAGHVITIDINPASIDSARRACSGVTSTILNDSVATLDMLGQTLSRPASLLYLDSFDLDPGNPMPSAIHHAMEMMAARTLIGPGTLVCIDDFDVPPLGPGGKGLIVDQFMQAIRAKVLHVGYQKIWQMTA